MKQSAGKTIQQKECGYSGGGLTEASVLLASFVPSLKVQPRATSPKAPSIHFPLLSAARTLFWEFSFQESGFKMGCLCL